MSEPKYTFKILTLGESGVGKTCILRRFVENKFSKNHLATIGIDFKTKTIYIKGNEVKLKNILSRKVHYFQKLYISKIKKIK